MKFIRSEYSLSIVTDEEINDIENQKKILNNLYHFNVEFSLTIRKFFPSNYEYENVSFEKVRISKVHKDKNAVDIMVFKEIGSLIVRDIKFEDIVKVDAITMKHDIMGEYIKISRWSLLEFEIYK